VTSRSVYGAQSPNDASSQTPTPDPGKKGNSQDEGLQVPAPSEPSISDEGGSNAVVSQGSPEQSPGPERGESVESKFPEARSATRKPVYGVVNPYAHVTWQGAGNKESPAADPTPKGTPVDPEKPSSTDHGQDSAPGGHMTSDASNESREAAPSATRAPTEIVATRTEAPNLNREPVRLRLP
jgi:hypothetical protein